MALRAFASLRSHHHYASPERLHLPNGNPHPLRARCPLPSPPSPGDTTLLPVSERDGARYLCTWGHTCPASFCVWLTPVGASPGFLHVPAHTSTGLRRNHSCRHMPHCAGPWLCQRALGCAHRLDIVNSPALNTGLQIPVCSLPSVPGVELEVESANSAVIPGISL